MTEQKQTKKTTYQLYKLFVNEKKLDQEFKEFVAKHGSEKKVMCKICYKACRSQWHLDNIHSKTKAHIRLLERWTDMGGLPNGDVPPEFKRKVPLNIDEDE